MKRRSYGLALCAGLAFALGSCGWFDDPTPKFIRVVIDGEAGKQLRVISSTSFTYSVDEFGGQEVTPSLSDTTIWTLPIDSIVNIEQQFQYLIYAVPTDSSTIPLQFDFRINDERSSRGSAEVNFMTPLRYLMQFNQPVAASFTLA